MKLPPYILTAFILLFSIGASAQSIIVDNTATANFCVNNVLLGTGVTATNITYTGAGVQIGTFDATGTTFPIPNGVILSSGDVAAAAGPNNQTGSTGNIPIGPGDIDLSSYVGLTNDAAVLEFDFVPIGDTVKFNYVFASEEYPEFLGFADVFGFFLSGPGITGTFSSPAAFPNGSINIAELPNSGGVVSVGNVNNGPNNTGPCQNCQFYVANGLGNTPNVNVSIQYDGHTVVLTAIAPVQCGQTYHIKIAIADNSDNILDSGVFLEANSFSSDAVEVNVATVTGDTAIIEGCDDATFQFIRPSDDTLLVVYFDILGTAQNGIDYQFVPDSIIFPIGVDTMGLTISTIEDDFIPGGNEAPESIIITVYTISPCGDTLVDSGYVWIIEEPALVLTVSNDTTLTCPLDSIQLFSNISGGIPGYNFTWNNSGTDTLNSLWVNGNTNGIFEYVISVTDSCALLTVTDTISVTINIPPPLLLNMSNDTTTVCSGNPAFLSASASGGAGTYDYLWLASGVSAPVDTVNPVATTTYLVQVTDACGTITIDSVVVTVQTNGAPVIDIDDIMPTCIGDSVTLVANVTGGTPGYSFSWDGVAGTNTLTTSPTTTTSYILQVVDQCGALSSEIVNVTMPTYAPLTLSISAPDTVCENIPNDLTAASSGGAGGNVFLWSGNTDVMYTDNTITSTSFDLMASSTVTLTVTDLCGVTTSQSLPVFAIPCELVIPNVITTNADGKNDFFYVENLDRFKNYVKIVNRWGSTIYEKTNYQNDWDGRNKSGQFVSEGTYFYIITLEDGREFNGHLTIFH